jgi:hypothetical protein
MPLPDCLGAGDRVVGKVLCEGVDEKLKALGVQIWQFQEAPVASGGLHGAIDIAPFEDVLDCANGLDTMGREAPRRMVNKS